MPYLLIKALLLPPGLFLALGAMAVVSSRRCPRLARGMLGVLLALMYLLSAGFVADRAAGWIEPPAALSEPGIAAWGAQAIVVLGAARVESAPEFGGHDTVGPDLLVRLRYAAYLHRQTGLPILVTGGPGHDNRVPEAELMAHALWQSFGVPVAWLESRSMTTWENAVFSQALLETNGVKRVLLVTQAFHMARAVACFERVGLSVLAAPTGFVRHSERPLGYRDFLPSADALLFNTRVLHELLGSWYYRARYLG